MKKFVNQIYGSQLTYSASLLRKCAKIYKETAITIDNYLVKSLKEYSLDPNIAEIEDVFPRVFDEQMNYDETLKKLSIIS